MTILKILKGIVHDAFAHQDPYAITILVLLILLLISFLRRKYLIHLRNEYEEDALALKKELKEREDECVRVKKELINCSDQIGSLVKCKKELEDGINVIQERESQIRKNYSNTYTELLKVKELYEEVDAQLKNYRLSPHFFKNLINNAFLGSKVVFNKTDLKPSFSFLGKRFYSFRRIESRIRESNRKLEKSLELLINLLNYLLYSTSKVHISTELTELDRFGHLLEICKGIHVEVEKKDIPENLYVPATIFFNYVDNSVKHGYFKKEKTIKINVQYSDNWLDYTVITPIHSKTKEKDLGGIGNVDFKSFLEKNCDNKYEMSYCVTENHYQAKLYIQL